MSLETDVQHMLRSLSKKEMNAVAATWNEVMKKGNTGHLDQIQWDLLFCYEGGTGFCADGYYCAHYQLWVAPSQGGWSNDCFDGEPFDQSNSVYYVDDPYYLDNCQDGGTNWQYYAYVAGPYATSEEAESNCPPL